MRFTPIFVLALSSLPAVVAKHPAEPPRITGVAGIAYDVTNLNRARGWYEGFLGFEEAGAVKNPDGTEHAAFVKINDHQYIELIQEPATNHGFLHGAIFQTNDAEGMRQLLKSRGIAVPDKVSKDAAGNLAFDVTDPSGFDLESYSSCPTASPENPAARTCPRTALPTTLTISACSPTIATRPPSGTPTPSAS